MNDYNYIETVTIADILASKAPKIYYSTVSAWWTHDPEDLGRTESLPRNFQPAHTGRRFGSGMPCDPTGAVLYEMDSPERWIAAAESKPEHFGKHGLKAFMASHAKNCGGLCSASWDKYNELIDNSLKNQ